MTKPASMTIRAAIKTAHDCFLAEHTTDTPRPSEADIAAARVKLDGEVSLQWSAMWWKSIELAREMIAKHG